VLNKELISATIPTLNLNDTVQQALDLMSEFNVLQLPVVADDKYLGLVFEEDLMNLDDRATLKTIDTHFSKVAVHAHTHFIEAVQILNEPLFFLGSLYNDNKLIAVIPNPTTKGI